MGVVYNRSTLVSNEAAQPIVYNHVGLYGARMRSIVAKSAWAATGDSNNSTSILCKLHPEWRVIHIWLYTDAMTSGTDYDLGLATNPGDSSTAPTWAVVACYADGQTFANALTSSPLDAAYITWDINKMGHHGYEDAGHTTANKVNEYWLGIKANTIGTSVGDFVVNVEFTSD